MNVLTQKIRKKYPKKKKKRKDTENYIVNLYIAIKE